MKLWISKKKEIAATYKELLAYFKKLKRIEKYYQIKFREVLAEHIVPEMEEKVDLVISYIEKNLLPIGNGQVIYQ